MIRMLVTAIIFVFSISVHAEFINEHEQGWHWYEEKSLQQNEQKHTIKTVSSWSPEQRLQNLKIIAKQRLSIAVMEPTTENIQAYIRAQNLITNIAQRFSNRWQQVLWQTPELDYRLKAPVNQMAGQIKRKQEYVNRENKLKNISKEYGLFFIFQSTCPYCHKFAGTLKSFAEQYGFDVIPISMDGVGLPEYPNPKRPGVILERIAIKAVPAVFAVAPGSKQIIPITYGLISIDELEKRVEELL